MSARFMKYANVAGKQIAIYVAAEVQHAGYKRAIDAIEPAILNDTVTRVENALASNKLLSTAQAGRTKSVMITSMPHQSPADPNMHSTIVAQDDQGSRIATGHVTTDTNQQQVAR